MDASFDDDWEDDWEDPFPTTTEDAATSEKTATNPINNTTSSNVDPTVNFLALTQGISHKKLLRNQRFAQAAEADGIFLQTDISQPRNPANGKTYQHKSPTKILETEIPTAFENLKKAHCLSAGEKSSFSYKWGS